MDEDVVVLSRVLPLLLLCMALLLLPLTCALELTVRLLTGMTVDGGVAYISLLVFDMRLYALSLACGVVAAGCTSRCCCLFVDVDDIPSAASVTALMFSTSSRGIGVRSLVGLARSVRVTRFAVAVSALMLECRLQCTCSWRGARCKEGHSFSLRIVKSVR
jgi:hypothetical protein